MDLKTYAERRGASAELSRALHVSSVTVSHWVSGRKKPTAGRCVEIETATNGAVRCEDLRPDIQWGVLRERRRQRAAVEPEAKAAA